MKTYRVKGYETVMYYVDIRQRINMMPILKQWMFMLRLATTRYLWIMG